MLGVGLARHGTPFTNRAAGKINHTGTHQLPSSLSTSLFKSLLLCPSGATLPCLTWDTACAPVKAVLGGGALLWLVLRTVAATRGPGVAIHPSYSLGDKGTEGSWELKPQP